MPRAASGGRARSGSLVPGALRGVADDVVRRATASVHPGDLRDRLDVAPSTMGVNHLGQVRLMLRLLPVMAERGSGTLVGGRVLDAYGATEMGTVALDGVLMPGVTARVVDGVVEITSPLAREPFRGDRGEIVDGRLRILGRADGAASAGEPLHEHRLRDWLSDKGIQADISLVESPMGQRFAVATADEVDPDTVARDLGNAYRPIVRRRPLTYWTDADLQRR